jgi:hypothetical protein
VAAQTLPSYMKDGNEAARWILYNRAGTGWQVMCLIDNSVDGTVGQVQNCYFYQTSLCVFI